MSFLFDIPALVLLGYFAVYLHQTRLRRRNEDWLAFLSMGIVGLFWAVAFPLTFGLLPNFLAPLLEPLPLLADCGDGPTFMWNSCLPLGITPSPSAWPLALVIFLSYPLWLYVGVGLGKALFGQTPKQKGFGALRF